MNRIILMMSWVTVVVVGGILAFDAMYTVHQTQACAWILQFGRYVRTESDPGLHFKKPFLESVEYFENRLLDLDPPAQEVVLADQKRVNVDAFVRYTRLSTRLNLRKRR